MKIKGKTIEEINHYLNKGYYQYKHVKISTETDIQYYDLHEKEFLIQYEFPLYDCQKQAIVNIEKGIHTMVVAPTATGKTLIGEYAIQRSLSNGKKAIYLSPLKTLSNQKYHNFHFRFPHAKVGIRTGDIRKEEGDEDIMIYTAETLKGIITRNKRKMKQIEWLVIDEAQFIGDETRGFVWESILLDIPSHIKVLFLTASKSNQLDFMEWFGTIKKCKTCYVETDFRPITLEHIEYRFDGERIKERPIRISSSKKSSQSIQQTQQKKMKRKQPYQRIEHQKEEKQKKLLSMHSQSEDIN